MGAFRQAGEGSRFFDVEQNAASATSSKAPEKTSETNPFSTNITRVTCCINYHAIT